MELDKDAGYYVNQHKIRVDNAWATFKSAAATLYYLNCNEGDMNRCLTRFFTEIMREELK